MPQTPAMVPPASYETEPEHRGTETDCSLSSEYAKAKAAFLRARHRAATASAAAKGPRARISPSRNRSGKEDGTFLASRRLAEDHYPESLDARSDDGNACRRSSARANRAASRPPLSAGPAQHTRSYPVARGKAYSGPLLVKDGAVEGEVSPHQLRHPAVRSDGARQSVPLPSHLVGQLADAGLRRLGLSRPPDGNLEALSNPAQHGAETDGTLEELEDRLVTEIRTSGLRRGRESALVGLVREMRSARLGPTGGRPCPTAASSAVLPAARAAIRSWKAHADAVAAAAGRELEAADRRVEEAVRGTKRADVAREEAERVAAFALEEARRIREEAKRSTAESDERVAAKQREFLGEMEREVARIQAHVQEEAVRAADEARHAAESEANQCVDRMAKELLCAQEENVALREETTRLRACAGKVEAELVDLTRQREERECEIEEMVRCLQSDVDNTRRSAQRGEEVSNKLREDMALINKERETEIEKRDQERRDELDKIEERVKKIVEAKERRIKEAEERAARFEQRAEAAENFIKRLEQGFEERPGQNQRIR